MRRIRKIVGTGLFVSLAYMFVYECAACGMLFETSFVGWASFQGRRLLDIPGTKLFVWHKGLGELYNVSPNLVMAYRVGIAIVLFFAVGIVLGVLIQLFGRRSPGQTAVSSGDGPGRRVATAGTSSLAMASAVLAGIGIFGFGFATGFLAIILGTIAAAQIRGDSELSGKFWARAGQILGALDVIFWTLAMEYVVRV
ncbi:DUF4190 domain-containing protein [bacterium]|nr:DUF4190 domain-containing protein [bacterium]